MALVAYSDSEASDSEPTTNAAPKAPIPAKPSKPNLFQKSEGGKIKVALPGTIAQDEKNAGDGETGHPTKRARTAGAFGGFNSLLPAPKRAAAPQATSLKKGVSLKTSSEAAFSRAPPPSVAEDGKETPEDAYDEFGNRSASSTLPGPKGEDAVDKPQEVKIVGKATRFKPLSVANNKKKKTTVVKGVQSLAEQQTLGSKSPPSVPVVAAPVTERLKEISKPVKRNLFSVPGDDLGDTLNEGDTDAYETADVPADSSAGEDLSLHNSLTSTVIPPAQDSLEAVAEDLNLTPAQRRHLFGRQAKGGSVQVAHFDMDAEYRSNEQLRQAGETVEHKAVNTVRSGKHTLSQLVNNARNNQESIEEKWAADKGNRGGARYGWGRG